MATLKERLFPGISQAVFVLGVASLLTDLSSEMIYPLLPLFLTTVLGAGPMALGVIEGVAESTAAFLKLASGLWTDKLARRKPFLLAGYGLSGVVRPLIGLATGWYAVLGVRFMDRVGKGLRTSPRDALIADTTPPERLGTAFGFHRGMDHFGAVLGPLVAAFLLSWMGFSLRAVFLLAAIPGVLVVIILALGIREQKAAASGHAATRTPLRDAFSPKLLWALSAFALFALGNSSDAFILLLLVEKGLSASAIALLWAAHHVVKMLASYGGGRLADHLGRKRMLLAGWMVYAVIYLCFALMDSTTAAIVVFLAYGVYYGLTEPSERAWVASLAPPGRRGAVLGLYNAVIGGAALPASLIFGAIWHTYGPAAAFFMGAGLAVLASLMLAPIKEIPANHL